METPTQDGAWERNQTAALHAGNAHFGIFLLDSFLLMGTKLSCCNRALWLHGAESLDRPRASWRKVELWQPHAAAKG